MPQINLSVFSSTLIADTTNTASTAVMRDTDGSINVGQVNCANVANSGTSTTSISATSTAAAGSTTSDAAILPSGGAETYIVTGADGTKGAKIAAADKVTGRLLFIANATSSAVLKIYPPSGGTINGASADAAYSTGSGKSAIIVCTSSSSNTWAALG